MGAVCVYCKTKHNLTIDHIIPASLGRTFGLDLNHKENLQVLCKDCNVKKGHSLKSNCPKTTRLLRQTIDRWLLLHGTPRVKRQYVFKNLSVTSMTPDTIYLGVLTKEEELKQKVMFR